jgi:uncharacterized delta-60 repeat protein
MKKKILFFCILKSLITFAQSPADIEHNFGPGPGFDGRVERMVTQPDGKIIIKGYPIYRNTRSKTLIRINPDGSLDPTFDYNPESGFDIKCFALQPDGKVLIGGSDPYDKIRVMRLNEDGSADSSFQIGAAIYKGSFVKSITLQPDGKILVTNKNVYITQKQLIRLNANGSVDTNFDIGTGFDSEIDAVAAQSDGKIIVGGSFGKFQGVTQTYLIRLNPDGAKDTSFITGTGFSGRSIYSIIIQNDGKIIVGGGFTSYQGLAQRYLIRLNTDGSRDTSFTNPVSFKDMDYDNVSNMCLQPDGKLIVSFYDYNGNSYGDDAVYRFNSDGSYDATFPRTYFNDGANLLTGNMDADVLAIALLNNGKILIGGKFNYCRKIIDKGIVCLNSDGSRDSSFNKSTGVDAAVFCSAVQTDGRTLIGGYFDNFQGVTQRKLIRLNVDGSKDTSFNLDSEFNDEVQSILLQADGKILVRGKFTNYGDSGRNYLARLNPDGTRDTSFIKTFGSTVEAMALQPDGKILVQTYVSNYPGTDLNKIIRLNANGNQDISFNTGNGNDFNKGVYSIVVQPDGKILIGGGFTSFKGITQKYLVRLSPDGSKDTSFDTGTGFDFSNAVGDITLQADGKVLVNGVFSPSDGDYQSFLIRLNSDGSKDVSFNQGTGIDNVRTGYGIGIRSVVLQNDGKILVGGEFDTYQGIAQNRLTRLNTDGSIDTSFDAGTGFEAPVYSLALYPDGKINVGGVFSSYRGVSSSSYLIRLKGTYVQPTVNATTIQSNLTCPGSSTGSASIVSVYNGKSPYTYLWSNGGTTATITGLAAGNYSCKITDADLSTITKSFIIITDSDFQKPIISAPEAVTVNANVDCTATGVALGTPIAGDNCSVASVRNDAPTSFPLGDTKVTWTVKDGSNNIATATQIVTVKGLDVTITKNAGKLSVAETGGVYKWLTCNNGIFTVIPNENNPVFTPKQLGSYAVEVTKNGCTATSTCFNVAVLGTTSFDIQNSFKLYPNPVKDFITIETNSLDNAKLNVFGVTGQIIFSKEIKATSTKINISNFPIGVYIFQVSNDTGTVMKKIIKD